MAKAKQPVSVAGIEFDALITSTENYEADVPAYVTEEGFSVSDNISLKPETIDMTLFVTDTPVTWKNRFGTNNGRVEQVVSKIQQLYFSRSLVTVTTSETAYTNMAISKLSVSKSSEVGYAREIPITLQKVYVTSTATTTISSDYGKSGTTESSSGTASTTSESESSSSTDASYLYKLVAGIRNIDIDESTNLFS